ncbi:MAG: hypothetical protein H6732_11330 [Alphaproteobacteria bacterium]|nr:hypothetical protein [Alphaproteobacteria bacterium]
MMRRASLVLLCGACSQVTVSGSVGGSRPELADAFFLVPVVDLRETETLLVRVTDVPGACGLFAKAHDEAKALSTSGGTAADYEALHARLFPPQMWVVDVIAELPDVDAEYGSLGLTHTLDTQSLPVETFRVEARHWTTPPDRPAWGLQTDWKFGDVFHSVNGTATLEKAKRGADVTLDLQVQTAADREATEGASLGLQVTAPLCPTYEGELNET